MFTLVKDEPDQHLYRYRSLLLNIHWDELRLEHLNSIAAACESVIKECGSMTSIVVMRGGVNVDLSTEARRAIADMMPRFDRHNRAQAVVVEADGFMASLARSVITGINLVARNRANQKVFQSSEEATRWLLELPAQPTDLRGSFGTVWPHVERLLRERSRSATASPRIAPRT